MKITEAQSRSIAREFKKALDEDPQFRERVLTNGVLADTLARFSEGTEHGKACAAEERAAQIQSVLRAVTTWMEKVYERCPRLEYNEVMELKITADQSGYCSVSKGDEEFEAFTFRIETTTTEGEF